MRNKNKILMSKKNDFYRSFCGMFEMYGVDKALNLTENFLRKILNFYFYLFIR